MRSSGSFQEAVRLLASNLDPQAALDTLTAAAARLASGPALVLRGDADEGAPLWSSLRPHVRSVVDSGRPVHLSAEDLPAGTARSRLVEAGIGSVAIFPLVGAGETFGVLAAGGPGDRLVAAPRLRRLALLADLGGLAIANATAYQHERRALQTSQDRLHELTVLHDATRNLSSSLSVEQIEREAVRAATRLMSGRPAAFLRVDGDSMAVAVADERMGEPAPAPISRLAPAALTGGHAVAAGSVALAPVFVRDEPYGVLEVVAEGGGFAAEELRRLEAIASLAGPAIANGRDFERVAGLEAVKTKLLHLASHELRRPLAMLRGYVSMLRDGTFAGQPEQLQDVYDILEARAGQMELLVTQMLEAARLEENRLLLDMRPIDLRQPVREAFDGARLAAGPEHGLRLEAPAGPVVVVADAARVTTIVANLLDNAIKYSPGGGRVRCVVRVDGSRALAEVSDQGMGIAAADHALLFTRFGRVQTPENRHIQGTGLGLYVSRELALMQSGSLTATSEAGEGSTFTLSLPLAPPGSG